ncbi:hypothetical protein IEQ34_025162 [Dendrobium chrysotoxum]|uniref:Phosphodiest-domain-containing protein n=1 Tax=Dendrobium chrysotoxum TaxID=161865 RepID=A0AAV7FRU0_DENCH|nr:hypothetical protein IEQ34_025162 [Dendrobium chrysotoxum]
MGSHRSADFTRWLQAGVSNSGLVPTLKALTEGKSDLIQDHTPSLAAEYMLPASPSLTFPNHWTLQTGLNPSSHGIVANDFHLTPHYDGRLRKNSSFYYTDPNQSWSPKWWRGVSIWEHLETNNVKTANLMWPGPRHFQRYQKGWTLKQRHDKIVSWLDLPATDRPQFICAYAPDVDTASHNFGPDVGLAPVATALRAVDHYIQQLFLSLAERNVTDLVNVIVVSDHGMTFTSNDRLIYLDDVLGKHLFDSLVTVDGWPNAGLRFRTSDEYAEAQDRLQKEQRRWNKRGVHAFDIVSREELVERFNWTMTDLAVDRTAPLWILPSVGWESLRGRR